MSTPAPRKATLAFGQQPLVYLITASFVPLCSFVAQALLPVNLTTYDPCSPPHLGASVQVLLFRIIVISVNQR
jgi:hypothetical protein